MGSKACLLFSVRRCFTISDENVCKCPSCLECGGPPVCVIRDCCKENGFSTCAECDKMPCDKLQPQLQGYRGHLAMLHRIKELGKDKWAKEMERKVKEGFSYIEVMTKNED
ncbi:MAG: DUF3795 domain-containing protein [Candidatus Bathyarchaeota archaeon]|nr:MAG: DUF3795 domain-containing protein [Candidatus Bathyarchaeota archaeon]